MTDPLTESEPPDPNRVEQSSVHETNVAGVDALALKNQANAVLQHAAINDEQGTAPPSDHTDTAHPPLHSNVSEAQSARRRHSGSPTPLKIRTQAPHEPAPLQIDTIATSPNLSKYVIPVAEGATGTLPAMHSNSPIEGTSGSPRGAKLPPLHQITGQMHDPLNVFAEVAAQQDPRGQAYTHHHSHSVGSTTSQSPLATHHAYPAAQQTSPALPYSFGARSPPRASLDQPFYGSPPQHQPSAYFAHRRPLIPSEGGAPPHPHLQPSHSSSGESLGHASASTADGYSTARTTPPAVTPVLDGPPRAVLPPLAGMGGTPGFKCDYPDCNAPPFQTQYLLSSHRNVHSSTRNHFCPYEGCARGEGGKGFKRKNEMIRHQLVHKSPGYVCPFCPDREHKYPRPDNLQRHVRVHHVDKDRDDPELWEVLAKRSEGSGKARRRRNTGASA